MASKTINEAIKKTVDESEKKTVNKGDHLELHLTFDERRFWQFVEEEARRHERRADTVSRWSWFVSLAAVIVGLTSILFENDVVWTISLLVMIVSLLVSAIALAVSNRHFGIKMKALDRQFHIAHDEAREMIEQLKAEGSKKSAPKTTAKAPVKTQNKKASK